MLVSIGMKKGLLFIVFIFFIVTPLLAVAHTVLATTSNDTLVSYWKFDEITAGSTVVDSSGHGNNGTPQNSPLPDTSVPYMTFPDARSLSFNGSNQSVSVPNASSINLTGSFTIAFWMNPTSWNNANSSGIISKKYDAGGTQPGYVIYDDGSQNCNPNCQPLINIRLKGSTGIDYSYLYSASSVTIGSWQHWAAVYDATAQTLTWYKNGILDKTWSGINTGDMTNTLPLDIGISQDWSGYYNGKLDDLRIYNRALSAAEISELAAGNHTTATWTGATSTDYENSANWNIGAVPDPYTMVTIGSGSNQPTMTANDAVAGLSINNGTSLTLGGNNLSFNDTSQTSGLATISGTLALQGGETLTGFNYSNATTGGTITYNGAGSYASLPTGNNYYNLTFNGSGLWTLANAIITNNNFTISSGTVNSGGNNITVSGNWSNSGIFTPSSDTVTLSGTSQTLSGTTSFYNLTKTVTSSATLTFPASLMTAISNTLTLEGTAGNLLSLRSSTPGTQFKINPQGLRNFSYLNPQDSNNTNATPIAYDSTFSYGTNLTNWATSMPTPTPSPTPAPTTAPSNNTSSTNSSSSPTTICTNTPPASAPSLFEITTSPTTATLYFTPVSPGTGYVISYGITPDANQYTTSFNYSDTSGAIPYTINSLNENTKYYFKVQGVNGCMPGVWSQTVSGITTGNESTPIANINQSGLAQLSEIPTPTPQTTKTISIVSQKQTATYSSLQACLYTVQFGDSLWAIAQNKLGNGSEYQNIVQQNSRLYPNIASHLSPGMRLQINCPPTPQPQNIAETSSGYNLEINVVNNGHPVIGATVELHSIPMRTVTDKNGIARFTNVQGGNHTIALAYNGYNGQDKIKVSGNKKNIAINISIQLNYSSFLMLAMAAIIGFLILIIGILCFILFKRRKKSPKEKSES